MIFRYFGSRVARCSIALATTVLALATVTEGKAAGASPSQEITIMTNDQAVAAANANFYSALNAMFTGDGQPMKDIWSHASDISYMGPSGHYLIGWDAIESEWDVQTAAKLGGRVTPQQINVVAGVDLAVVSCIESGENIIDGKTETVRLRATNVFRKEGEAWKLIAHQTDLLGYMNQPK